MSKKLYEESNIQEIASTIREKNGTQDTYKVSQMAGAMSDLIGPPAYNNMILAQDTEPDSEYNKVWFDTDADDEYTFPQIDDNNVSSTDTWSSQKINTENNTIKTDTNRLKTDVNDLKSHLDDYQNLGNLFDPIPGTMQTVTFDALGKPASIVHTRGIDILRTDSFVWTDNIVTETRTLANGKHVGMTTNLTTLITTISEIQEDA